MTTPGLKHRGNTLWIAAMAFQTGQAIGGECQVRSHCHMGKQCIVLKNVAALTVPGRQVNMRARIEQNAVIEQNAAGEGSLGRQRHRRSGDPRRAYS